MTNCPKCQEETELVALNPDYGGTVVRSCVSHGLVIFPLEGEPYLAAEITYPAKVSCQACGCTMDEGGRCYCCSPLESGFGRYWAEQRHGVRDG
jgi:hypothetical protein